MLVGMVAYVAYKAEWAGKPRHLVDPNSTSQECPACDDSVSKMLDNRVHACLCCGHSVEWDVASAQVIAWRAYGYRLGRDLRKPLPQQSTRSR
jgi:putative transposase